MISVKRHGNFILFLDDGDEFYDINTDFVEKTECGIKMAVDQVRLKQWANQEVIETVSMELSKLVAKKQAAAIERMGGVEA
jgi:hypothetical protein